MKIKQRSLRFELVVSLVLMVAAAAGFIGLLVFQYTQSSMVALKMESGIILAEALKPRFLTGNPGPMPDSLAERLMERRFKGLVMMDRFGRHKTTVGIVPDGSLDVILEKTLISGDVQSDLSGAGLFIIHQSPRLYLGVPIYKADRVVGAVGLYSDLLDLGRTWNQTRLMIIVYLVLDTLLTVLFGFYLIARRLVDPLRKLLDRVEALAAGHYHPRPDQDYIANEIGRLERSFEKMAQHILDQKARLEENIASLKNTQEHLVKSEKMASVGRLGAGLAHELGNPLGAVQGFIHLLRRSDLTHRERADFLNRMESEITRMGEIIRSLLDFARPTTPAPGPVFINDVVQNGLALASVQKWFSGLKVATDLADRLPPVRGEINRLTQILLNFLENAGQAMAGSGALTITTRQDGGQVTLTVSDTGPGIPPDQLPYIFDPFFTTKEPGQGTGLGLAVSQSIALSFNGRIEASNGRENGAEFTLFLPLFEDNDLMEQHERS